MPPASTRRAVLLSSATFAVLGADMTVPGTLLPLLLQQFGLRLVEAGSMLALQPVGYLVSVIVTGWLLGRYGMRAVLTVGMSASAVGLAGFAMTSGWVGGAAMLLIIGVGYGVLEVGANALLITAGGERRNNLLNFAHLFFGVGSFITPWLTAQAVGAGVSWRVVFLLAALVTGVVAVGWSTLTVDTEAAAAPTSGARPQLSPVAWLCAVMLALYVGTETGIGAWLTKYMVSVRGATLGYAGGVLSLYWFGLAAGRLALSATSHHSSEERWLVGLTLVATVACVAALLGGAWGAAVAFSLTGVGFSGIFPAVIALGGRAHPHATARVTSVMIGGAGIGGIIIPWTMSAIADAAGLVAGMAFYAGMCAAMVGLAAALQWVLSTGEVRALPRDSYGS